LLLIQVMPDIEPDGGFPMQVFDDRHGGDDELLDVGQVEGGRETVAVNSRQHGLNSS